MGPPPFLRLATLVLLLGAMTPGRAQPAAEQGVASFYGWHFHGRPMANGRPFRALGTSAASRTLPLGTRVVITNLRNGKAVHATIDDRGPYVGHRAIDVSLGLARRLGMERSGLAPVTVQPVDTVQEGRRRRKVAPRLTRGHKWTVIKKHHPH
jgi:rare lipoprotein A